MYETSAYSNVQPPLQTRTPPRFGMPSPDWWALQRETGTAQKGTYLLPRLVKIDHMAADKKTVLTPTAMNPGFVDSTDSLIVAPKLQQALSGLIKTKYKKFIRGANPSSRDGFSIALVDLSGSKLSKPEFAGWGSTVPRYAASTAKIVLLYAVFQLKFDLEIFLQQAGVANSAQVKKALADFQKRFGLPSRLTWATDFDFTFGSGGVTLSFGKALAGAIGNMVHNHNSAASVLLHRVSYPYIGSLLLQSGITHPTRGGLWLVSDYGNPDGTHKPWAGRPSLKFKLNGSHNATALSTVTFFTLMAQRKLVSPFDSMVIKELLRKACSMFWSGATPPLSGIAKRPAAKCGLMPKGGTYNDVILIEYDNGSYCYAACALTELVKDKTFYLNNLLVDLDALIRANNP